MQTAVKKDSEFWEVSEVARTLKRSAAMVRLYADSGRLPAIRTGRGARLFNSRDVEEFAKTLRK